MLCGFRAKARFHFYAIIIIIILQNCICILSTYVIMLAVLLLGMIHAQYNPNS